VLERKEREGILSFSLRERKKKAQGPLLAGKGAIMSFPRGFLELSLHLNRRASERTKKKGRFQRKRKKKGRLLHTRVKRKKKQAARQSRRQRREKRDVLSSSVYRKRREKNEPSPASREIKSRPPRRKKRNLLKRKSRFRRGGGKPIQPRGLSLFLEKKRGKTLWGKRHLHIPKRKGG